MYLKGKVKPSTCKHDYDNVLIIYNRYIVNKETIFYNNCTIKNYSKTET